MRKIISISFFLSGIVLIAFKYRPLNQFRQYTVRTEKNLVVAPSKDTTKAEVTALASEERIILSSLQTNDDNDPNIDGPLRQLSASGKALLRSDYLRTPAQNSRRRGTAVFLLGRQIESVDDIHFLKNVLSEDPCRNQNIVCNSEVVDSDSEEDPLLASSLMYPQLVAIASLQDFISSKPENKELARIALQTLKKARHSPRSEVREAATVALIE